MINAVRTLGVENPALQDYPMLIAGEVEVACLVLPARPGNSIWFFFKPALYL